MIKLLLTGSSGFIGQNIISTLYSKFEITTLGNSINDEFQFDLSKEVPNFKKSFDVVVHAAGKAHSVPRNKTESDQFQEVNYQGTINLCKALELNGLPRSFIFISTVAVYGLESGDNIDETYPLDGNSPYAISKIKAEEFLTKWSNKHNVILSILRPSLIAGPNPPGNLSSMIKGIKSGRYFRIGKGEARKSILMVEDIAKLIPLVAEKGGTYNVCDSYHPSFAELEELIAKQLKKSIPKSIPYPIAKTIAMIGDLIGNKAPINSSKLDKLTKSLTFSNEKARKELRWVPLSVIDNFTLGNL